MPAQLWATTDSAESRAGASRSNNCADPFNSAERRRRKIPSWNRLRLNTLRIKCATVSQTTALKEDDGTPSGSAAFGERVTASLNSLDRFLHSAQGIFQRPPRRATVIGLLSLLALRQPKHVSFQPQLLNTQLTRAIHQQH